MAEPLREMAQSPTAEGIAEWREEAFGKPEWPLTAASLVAWAAVGAMFVRHPRAQLVAWTVMAVAMMLPLARPQARRLALCSPRPRRPRAIGEFATAYVVVWAAAGAVAIAALAPVRGGALAVAAALGLAAAWHAAPWRRRLLARAQEPRASGEPAPSPLFGAGAGAGWRATAGCLRCGAGAGTRCLATCGPLMLPMAIAHQPALAVGTALVLAAEGRPGSHAERRAGRSLEAVCLALAALLVAIASLV
jgi:predicted metal-binding membrane protein